MSTMTPNRRPGGIRGGLPTRGLPIPSPPRQREAVVTAALDKLADALEGDRKKAQRVIDNYGLSIEVARLRDRLNRAASTELERLLLSTPGVAESLFLDAIEKELAAAQPPAGTGGGGGAPPDQTVLLKVLIDKLDKLDKLDVIAEALKELDDDEVVVADSAPPAVSKPKGSPTASRTSKKGATSS